MPRVRNFSSRSAPLRNFDAARTDRREIEFYKILSTAEPNKILNFEIL